MALTPLERTAAPTDITDLVPLRLIENGERYAALAEYDLRRSYYDGSQYDFENTKVAHEAGYVDANLRLPEHLRKHAYSSHISDAIDTLADMLAEGVQFEGPYAEQLNQWWADADAEDW